MITLTQQQQNPTAAAAPYKTYQQYFAGNPEALQRSIYHGSGTGLGEESGGGNWGSSGNPYRFRNEYNEYLNTLAPEYQMLAGANVRPEAIASGAVTGVWDPKTMKTIPVGFGAPQGQALQGSSHSLSPDILAKMWR